MSFFVNEINIKNGRIGRSKFFLRSLLVILFLIVLLLARLGIVLQIILLVAIVILPYLKLIYSRAHDIGQKWNIEAYSLIVYFMVALLSWNLNPEKEVTTVLWIISMIIGVFVAVTYFYLLFKKGVVWKNQYWDDPLKKNK